MTTGSTTELRAEGGGLAVGTAAGRLALTATVAASGMASLDATVVNMALPHIDADLDASISSLQWVLTGYLLTLASLILLGGARGDRYGRRRVFLIGTVWFAVASILRGAASSSGLGGVAGAIGPFVGGWLVDGPPTGG